jgi:L-cysteine desulfidase
MRNLIISCLKNEVKPATGCTEPVAISLACAHAAKAISDLSSIDSIRLIVSTNILKNAMNVGVPRTKKVGLEIAAALGVFSNSEDGLNLLSVLNHESVDLAHRFFETKPVIIERYHGSERIYIEVHINVSGEVHKAIIAHRHDQLVLYEVNGEIYTLNESQHVNTTTSYQELYNFSIIELLNAIIALPYSDLEFMMEGYHMNLHIAKIGLQNSLGLGLGQSIRHYSSKEANQGDLMLLAMQLTAAASDSRMSGMDIPVMTSNGSGNNGITAILPIVAANIIYNFDEALLVKALAMSHIINSYIKNEIGRLSPICACGVASATGSAVGLGYLLGIDKNKLPHLIDTMIANLSGMACDGAKLGCSLKLSTATAAAVQSVYLLLNNSYADSRNGIVGFSPEESIRNLGKLARLGMSEADAVMTDIMLSKSH